MTGDHETRSVLCCSTKFVEGTVHASVRLADAGARFNCGDSVVCDVQIPPVAVGKCVLKKRPFAVAANLLPSAEEAIACQFVLGAVAAVQDVPIFVEIISTVFANVASLVPSAEEVITPVLYPPANPVKFVFQVVPASIEVKIAPKKLLPILYSPSTNSFFPSADEAKQLQLNKMPGKVFVFQVAPKLVVVRRKRPFNTDNSFPFAEAST